jgi:hypothetical protein
VIFREQIIAMRAAVPSTGTSSGHVSSCSTTALRAAAFMVGALARVLDSDVVRCIGAKLYVARLVTGKGKHRKYL